MAKNLKKYQYFNIWCRPFNTITPLDTSSIHKINFCRNTSSSHYLQVATELLQGETFPLDRA